MHGKNRLSTCTVSLLYNQIIFSCVTKEITHLQPCTRSQWSGVLTLNRFTGRSCSNDAVLMVKITSTFTVCKHNRDQSDVNQHCNRDYNFRNHSKAVSRSQTAFFRFYLWWRKAVWLRATQCA